MANFLPLRMLPLRCLLLALASRVLVCSAGLRRVFGSKDDATTDEIFDEGQTDPTLIDDVGYVPLNPFYTQGPAGTLRRARRRLRRLRRVHLRRRRARPPRARPRRAAAGLVATVAGQPLRGITAIVQDRRLDVYVAARRDTTIERRGRGTSPSSTASAGSRRGTPARRGHHLAPVRRRARARFTGPASGIPRTSSADEDAEFTGVAPAAPTTASTSRGAARQHRRDGAAEPIVSRSTPSSPSPPRAINTQYIRALSPTGRACSAPPTRRTCSPSSSRRSAPAARRTRRTSSSRRHPPGRASSATASSRSRSSRRPPASSTASDTGRLARPRTRTPATASSTRSSSSSGPRTSPTPPTRRATSSSSDAAKDSLFVFNRERRRGRARRRPGPGRRARAASRSAARAAGALQFREPAGRRLLRPDRLRRRHGQQPDRALPAQHGLRVSAPKPGARAVCREAGRPF